VIDVLAPTVSASRRRPAAQFRTIQIPGGSQALSRIERVALVIDGLRPDIFRPSLLGAVLLKARALPVHSRPEDEREDLVQLLSLVTDPRAIAATMTRTERRWLRAIENRLDLGTRPAADRPPEQP
jgi:hypothetical protein